MKYQTTKKAVMQRYNCLSVGYCQLQGLLHFMEPESYTTRQEGWGADVYNIGNGIVIVTGYAPFGAKVDYRICRKYDDRALKILYNDKRYKTVDGKRKALAKLIENFKKEVKNS